MVFGVPILKHFRVITLPLALALASDGCGDGRVLKFLLSKFFTIKILKFGTPQTIAIIVLKIEKFDVTLH